jgi:hypothetical protein
MAALLVICPLISIIPFMLGACTALKHLIISAGSLSSVVSDILGAVMFVLNRC